MQYPDGRRKSQIIRVDVDENSVNEDSIRVTESDELYVTQPGSGYRDFGGRGQGTWMQDGEIGITLQGIDFYDMDISLWKYDFETGKWGMLSQSRTSRSIERIRQRITRGFYYIETRFHGVPNPGRFIARLTTQVWRSKRDVCLLDSFLKCRGPKI